MSVENAEKLLAKLRADKALAVKLQTATRTAFEQIAEEAGLACTSQDVKAVMDKMMKSGELSEEQLGNVAGGGLRGLCLLVLVTAQETSLTI